MPDIVDVPGPGFAPVFMEPQGMVGQYLYQHGQYVAAAARNRVRVRTGNLRNNIKTRFIPTVYGDLAVEVYADVDYAMYEEDGTKPHVIMPRHVSVLRFVGKDGNIHFSRIVHHPGTKGSHFLTDALPAAIA